MATMKKILLSILFTVLFTGISLSAVKVNIYLTNPNIATPGGYWKIDVIATILPAQTWRVGSSNLKGDWVKIPPNTVTNHSATAAPHPLACLHSNANYSAMTTTSILGGTAVS